MASMASPLPIRSGNPALGDDTFRGVRVVRGDAMTVGGTVNKTALALAILMVAAATTWNMGASDPRVATDLHHCRHPRRPRPVLRDDLAEGVGADHDAALRRVRRVGARRHLARLRDALSGPRRPGGVPHLRHAGRAAGRLPLRVAAFNLVLDFDFIEQGAERGAPKYMEWYGAFGLLVTLVWLYLEMLRLLAKLQERR
jgi:hypothetical protein